MTRDGFIDVMERLVDQGVIRKLLDSGMVAPFVYVALGVNGSLWQGKITTDAQGVQVSLDGEAEREGEIVRLNIMIVDATGNASRVSFAPGSNPELEN